MAKRKQVKTVKVVVTDDGTTWVREPGLNRYEHGNYETQVNGVRYELEKRTIDQRDTQDTGWYLYSLAVPGFFGDWCAKTILEAAEMATEMIHTRDLRPLEKSSIEQ